MEPSKASCRPVWLLVLALVGALPCALAADTARTVANARELGLALSDQQVTTITIKGAPAFLSAILALGRGCMP
jgi:hypothetical protein